MKINLSSIIQNFFQLLRTRISQFAIFLTVLIALSTGIHFEKWNHDKVVVHDVISYYAYLPAIFIHYDINFEFGKNLPDDIARNKLWTKSSPIQKPVLKMSMGNAICWVPFFSLAHLYASLDENYENHGYSKPYYFMIFIAALCYLAIGLIYLRKIMIKFFSDRTVAIVLIIIVLATNLLYYVSLEPGMSHVYSFALISMFLYFSLEWLKNPSIRLSIIIGLLLGLITLIRPTNIIIVLFPVLIFLFDKKPPRIKISFISSNFKHLIVIAISSFVFFIPQLIYWKMVTGQYAYYTYGAENFYFCNPHILDGLLSYRKGWLVYTPVMTFSIIGLFFLPAYIKRFTFPIIIFLLLNIYIIFSWWSWWYGGSYGSRPMIDAYPVFAFPIAAFIHYFSRRAVWLRMITASVFIFFIYLNFFQIFQYSISLLHYDSMTKEAYWKIFFKKKYPENYNSLIKTPDYKSAEAGKEEY